MRTVFIVVQVDRHTEIDVSVFKQKQHAIGRYDYILNAEWKGLGYDWEEEEVDDWLRFAQGEQGNSIRVQQVVLLDD